MHHPAGGLTEPTLIYLNGQTYAGNGKQLLGTARNDTLPRVGSQPGRPGVWQLYMPPASAALVVIPAAR